MRFQPVTCAVVLAGALLLTAPVAAEDVDAKGSGAAAEDGGAKGSGAAAGDGGAKAPGRGGCRAEIDAICPDTRPGSPERRTCIRDNTSKLSETCQQRMLRRRNPASAGIEGLRGACGDEIDRYCDEERGGRMIQCLREKNADELSEECSGYLEILAGMRKMRKGSSDDE